MIASAVFGLCFGCKKKTDEIRIKLLETRVWKQEFHLWRALQKKKHATNINEKRRRKSIQYTAEQKFIKNETDEAATF